MSAYPHTSVSLKAWLRGITFILFAVALVSVLLNTLANPIQRTKKIVVGQGYWHTAGAQLLDVNNYPVHITGINWFGFETPEYTVLGLQTRSYKSILDQIKALHYNALRLPYSNQLFDMASTPKGINYAKNPDLVGLHGIELMDKIINYASQIGLHIILDRHRPDSQAQSALWYTKAYPESRWISDWQMLARHYKNDPMVIGADLHNEPHTPACWGCGDVVIDWQQAAQRAGDAILTINPNWLIFVEGVDCYHPNPAITTTECYFWGGNLQGVASHPAVLSIPHRLVYSAHDYPSTISMHSWFNATNYPANLPNVWDSYWGFIVKQNIAPVWLGEFGTKLQTSSDRQWFVSLVNYLGSGKSFNWTFWCLNPESGDTGGILNDDWITVNLAKQQYLNKIEWKR